MIGAAAQKIHVVRAVGVLEAEHVDEKRHLLGGIAAVEHDVADLGRPRTVQRDVGVLRDIRCDAHRQTLGRREAEAIAAAGDRRQWRRLARHRHAVGFRLGAERVDRGAVGRGEVHAEQARLRPLADGEHMVIAAGGAQVNAVAVGTDLFERPGLGIKIRRLLQIAHAELDAAHAGHFAVRHCSPPGNFAAGYGRRGWRSMIMSPAQAGRSRCTIGVEAFCI